MKNTRARTLAARAKLAVRTGKVRRWEKQWSWLQAKLKLSMKAWPKKRMVWPPKENSLWWPMTCYTPVLNTKKKAVLACVFICCIHVSRITIKWRFVVWRFGLLTGNAGICASMSVLFGTGIREQGGFNTGFPQRRLLGPWQWFHATHISIKWRFLIWISSVIARKLVYVSQSMTC